MKILSTNKFNNIPNQKIYFKNNEQKAENINNKQENEYVKVTKTQNTLNHLVVGWALAHQNHPFL